MKTYTIYIGIFVRFKVNGNSLFTIYILRFVELYKKYGLYLVTKQIKKRSIKCVKGSNYILYCCFTKSTILDKVMGGK